MALQPEVARSSNASPVALASDTKRVGEPRPLQITKQGDLQLDLSNGLTAEQLVFIAEIRSLAKRVAKNDFWARDEIYLLLESAASAAIVAENAAQGALILKRATEIYERALVARNRITYATGTAVGVVVLILLSVLVVAFGRTGLVPSLASTDVLVALFAFSGLGSVTSVLIRLSGMDLREETSKILLMLSGASKPLVAVSFASIVYLVLKYQLVAITIGQSQGGANSEALYWVAAFLCGFSERFGSDIIARLEPSTDDKRA